MSDMLIPELIELNSYWQKAVEDAICDTLKGEKRLYHALRNREKINKKLEELGMTANHSIRSLNENYDRNISKKSSSNFYSCEEASKVSYVTMGCDKDTIGYMDPERPTAKSTSSSRSRETKKTPPEKKPGSPDQLIFGDGSLEKMKKSQNSFCCEPMGMKYNGKELENNPDLLLRKNKRSHTTSDSNSNKNIKWLHKRNDNAFENSDSETLMNEENLRLMSAKNPPKKLKRSRMFSKKRKSSSFYSKSNKKLLNQRNMSKNKTIPMTLDPKEDLFWENQVKSALRTNAKQDRKLYFALAKRDIINRNQRRFKKKVEDTKKIRINESKAKIQAKVKQGKKFLSPFAKFYLEIYRDLASTCPLKEVTAQAVARWCKKSIKNKVFKKKLT